MNFSMAVVETLLFGLFVVLVVKVFLLFKTHYDLKKVLKTMPEPKMFPFYGIVFKTFGAEKMLSYLMSLTETIGSPVHFSYGVGSLGVLIGTPNDIKIVLSSENSLDKAPFYKFLNLGKGLFVSDKSHWRKNRKLLSRVFNTQMLHESIPIICDKSQKFVTTLEQKSEGEEFDMMESVVNCVLETLFETLFDLKTEDILREKYKKDAEK